MQKSNHKTVVPPSVFDIGLNEYGAVFVEYFESYEHPWDRFGWNEGEARKRIADKFNLT